MQDIFYHFLRKFNKMILYATLKQLRMYILQQRVPEVVWRVYDVVGIDTPNVDLVLNFDTFPKPDSFVQTNAQSWQGGGKVATGLVAAARLGAKTAVLGAVGDDRYGGFCLADFARHGVDTGGLLVRKGERTPLAVVLSDRETGSRTIVWTPGTAAPIAAEEIPPGYLGHTKWFYIAGADDATLSLAAAARAAGAKVLVDADFHEGDFARCLPYVDVFIASEFVFRSLCGEGADPVSACEALRKQGPGIAVVTLGKHGCAGAAPEGSFRLPAYTNVDIVDTLGAGDVFHGAFLTGLLQEWGAEECARFASAVAAIKCTQVGGRAGIPDIATARKFMETGIIDGAELAARAEFYKRGIDHV